MSKGPSMNISIIVNKKENVCIFPKCIFQYQTFYPSKTLKIKNLKISSKSIIELGIMFEKKKKKNCT